MKFEAIIEFFLYEENQFFIFINIKILIAV